MNTKFKDLKNKNVINTKKNDIDIFNIFVKLELTEQKVKNIFYKKKLTQQELLEIIKDIG